MLLKGEFDWLLYCVSDSTQNRVTIWSVVANYAAITLQRDEVADAGFNTLAI